MIALIVVTRDDELAYVNPFLARNPCEKTLGDQYQHNPKGWGVHRLIV